MGLTLPAGGDAEELKFAIEVAFPDVPLGRWWRAGWSRWSESGAICSTRCRSAIHHVGS